MLRRMIAGAVAAACVGLAAPAVQAQVNFGSNFNVNPSSVGEPNGTFTANFINFNYQAEIDQSAGVPAPFAETGAGSFTAFSTSLSQPAISAGTTGLLVNYNLYATFSGVGT